MTDDEVPKNTRELYFYIKGEFGQVKSDIIKVHERIDTTRKITFWVGGLAGGIMTMIIGAFLKIAGLFK